MTRENKPVFEVPRDRELRSRVRLFGDLLGEVLHEQTGSAVLFSQTVLTTFSILSGLGLVLFVEPPFRWFVGGDRYSGDKRPLLLCLIMLALFVSVMAVPPWRQFWELLPLEAVDYALIIGTTIVWAFVLRYVWRARLFERFLHLEAMVDLSEDWLLEELKQK